MADRLTQLQDAIDEFLVQCFAGLNYNYHSAPYAEIPDQPSQAHPTVSFSDPPPADDVGDAQDTKAQEQQRRDADKGDQAQTQPAAKKEEETPEKKEERLRKKDDAPGDLPHSREEHAASLRELAQGLVLKEQQIEYLIQSLPGIGSSERDQERRIRELQEELRVVEAERKEKEVARERLIDELGTWLVEARRVP